MADNDKAKKRRERADMWARVVSVLVLVLGAILIITPAARRIGNVVWNDDPFTPRTSTATVTKVTAPGQPRLKTTKTVVTAGSPGVPATTTTTVTEKAAPGGAAVTKTVVRAPRGKRGHAKTVTTVRQTAAASTQTTTTTAEASESLLERSLAAGGLLLFRLGLVALAAFLAGAVVQRAIVGSFAIKIGPLELGELRGVAADSLDKVAADVEKLSKTSDELTRQFDRQGRQSTRTASVVTGLAERVKKLEVQAGTEKGQL